MFMSEEFPLIYRVIQLIYATKIITWFEEIKNEKERHTTSKGIQNFEY